MTNVISLNLFSCDGKSLVIQDLASDDLVDITIPRDFTLVGFTLKYFVRWERMLQNNRMRLIISVLSILYCDNKSMLFSL